MAKHALLSKPKTHFKRAMAVATVLLTLVGSLQISAASATEPLPSMVKNINETTQDSFNVSPYENEGSVVIGSTLYFAVAGGLWKSDGTEVGTSLVRQFDAYYNTRISPYVVGAKLYFSAYDATSGQELWVSDGSSAGTQLVRDINPGEGGSFPRDFEQINGVVYFFTEFGGQQGLWKSDGTLDGTMEHRTNAAYGMSELTAVGSSLFFLGGDSLNGYELWTSEGPSGSTAMLKNIRPNSPGSSDYDNGSFPQFLTAVGNTLYFRANSGSASWRNDIELWKTDGTEINTVLVEDIYAGGASSSQPNYLTAVGSELFFSATDASGNRLWKTDGTTTVKVTLTDSAEAYDIGKIIKHPSQNRVFFAASSSSGLEMWKSDGTTANTVPISDLNLSNSNPFIESPALVGTDLFFVAGSGNSYGNLWKYNGISSVLVRATNSLQSSDNELQILNSTSSLLFLSVYTPEFGRELWKSDGTTLGTVLVKDVTALGYSGYDLDTSTASLAVGSTLYFEGNDGISGSELWKSDGTLGGTVLVSDIRPGASGSFPAEFTAVGSWVFFSASDGIHGRELWKTNGVTTILVEDINTNGSYSSSPSELTLVGTTLFFTANDGIHGEELWKSDGSATGLVEDIYPLGDDEGAFSSYPEELTAMGTTLFFAAEDAEHGVELWKTDGITTERVIDANPGPGNGYPHELTAMGDKLFFTALDINYERELWSHVGTTTGIVDDILPIGSSSPEYLTVLGSTLYFAANDGVHGRELWKTDGTENELAADVDPTEYGYGPGDSRPSHLTVVGGTLFFVATVGSKGELWKIDGVSTSFVKIVQPEGADSPENFVVFGSALFFSADDGIHGFELWKSDGTTTSMVADLNPIGDSYPSNLRVVGDKLFFGANDGLNGIELWSLAPASIPPLDPIIYSSDTPTPSPTPSPTPTAPVVTEPSTTKAVRFSRFVADSGKLPALASQAIARTLSGYSTIDRVVCTGFTSGVKATAFGRKVALQRAQNACNVAKRLAPKVLIQVRVNVASGVGPKFRTVQLHITGN
jgi:ELWxxDGT repeat protein